MNWIFKQIIIIGCLIFLCENIFSQTISLEGFITNQQGDAVGNSQVYLKKQKLGSLTNLDGYFRINNVDENDDVLEVSCLGYKKQNVAIQQNLSGLFPLVLILEDSITNLEEFVVTASRVQQKKNEVAIPVNVITADDIRNKGFVRLNEVLSEQPGLQIVSDHGAGLQMQGLSSDYILILIDGEPVIGRTSGTLDLSRISVGNIDRIEIIKGPSSSLYGNEALAGVVNIITAKETEKVSFDFSSLLRTNNTINTRLNAGFNKKKWNVSIHADRLSSEGYDLSPETVAKTTPSFVAYTFKEKISYQILENFSFRLRGSYFTDNQSNNSIVKKETNIYELVDITTRKDFRLIPSFQLKISSNHILNFKNSTSVFESNSEHTYALKKSIYDQSSFRQILNRSELKYDWNLRKNHTLIAGSGYTFETVDATRYEELNGLKSLYVFSQYNGKFSDKINLSPSIRYDVNSQYGFALNPKMALRYSPKKWLSFNGSLGTGFKTPDFRQLLLNFTNPTVGYTVFGSKLAKEKTLALSENGEIDAFLSDFDLLGELKPEKSLAYNFGFLLDLPKGINIQSNFFINKISNLIEHAPIARKTNGQNIYSYFNRNKVITEGIETSLGWKISKNFSANISYQYLLSKDLEMLELIKAGKVYRKNNSTGKTEKVKVKDYGGLPNRSKNSGNIKVAYQNYTYDFRFAIRGIYRGEWGVADQNGNEVIDTKEEYAKGYCLWNFSIDKHIFKRFNLQAGIMNLLGTTSKHETALSGRVWYGGFQFSLATKE